ncbi:unnamed protein product [Rotaria magnacalcarata]|uniref:NAD(P)(+)--arginine ADP-ribosyltransferase n=1 Tax=Rotaria magnacalcarata TaxID=392030 RepID=A0A8S2PYD9_9BILA|nr:unnamed protein product [Rotaria magnacalcarata]
MDSEISTKMKRKTSLFRHSEQSKVSNLYRACQTGNIYLVQNILSSTSYTDINRLEPNGSTSLHAAAFFGHADIVQFLLQYGVMRDQQNGDGLTAREVASKDEIRQLFHRSLSSERFRSDTIDDAPHLFTTTIDGQSQAEDNHDQTPSGWVYADRNQLEARILETSMHITKTMATSPILQPLLKHVMRNNDYTGSVYDKDTAVKELQCLIDEYITPSHSEYKKACELVSKYNKTDNVEHLLRLYSLETPFYKILGRSAKNDCLAIPVLYKLNSLRKRAFQGRSFRGLTMTQENLQRYKWALQHKGSILSVNILCSTSIDENVARYFIGRSSLDKISVLMVFNFRKKCDTAIQLFSSSDNLPGISDFEDEHEVLVLPLTIFHVTSIDIDKTNGNISQSLGLNALFLTLGAAGHSIPMFELAKAMKNHNVTFITEAFAQAYINTENENYSNRSSFRLIFTNDSTDAIMEENKIEQEIIEYFMNHSVFDGAFHIMPAVGRITNALMHKAIHALMSDRFDVIISSSLVLGTAALCKKSQYILCHTESRNEIEHF